MTPFIFGSLVFVLTREVPFEVAVYSIHDTFQGAERRFRGRSARLLWHSWVTCIIQTPQHVGHVSRGEKIQIKRNLPCQTQRTFIIVSNVEHWVIRRSGLHFEWQHFRSFVELLGNRQRDKACQAMMLLASVSLLPTWRHGFLTLDD